MGVYPPPLNGKIRQVVFEDLPKKRAHQLFFFRMLLLLECNNFLLGALTRCGFVAFFCEQVHFLAHSIAPSYSFQELHWNLN